jgi:hypothetical protein
MASNDTEYEATYSTDGYGIPKWYTESVTAPHGRHNRTGGTWNDVVATLTDEYGATTRAVYYEDESQGGKFEIPHRAAVVNPAWEGEDGTDDAPQDHAAWTTASTDYTPVNADEALGTFTSVAHNRGYEHAYGKVVARRNGGEVVAEILLDDLRMEYEGTEYVFGIEAGYDHFGNTAVWSSLIAYNTETGAPLRHLSERMAFRHQGTEVRERVSEWYENVLERAETLRDEMLNVVADADAYEVEVSELPASVAEWYEAMGFPTSYAERAANRVPTPAGNNGNPTALDLYNAITSTLQEEFNGKRGGSAIQRHASRANEILFAPDAAERAALETLLDGYENQAALEEYEDGEVPDAEEVEGVRERYQRLQEGIEQFEGFRDRVRTILDGVEADDEEGGNGESENQAALTDGGW